MKSPTFSKKAWMIVSTLLVIFAIFTYYFLVYVKQQEATLIRNSLRVLAQIGENYHDLEKGYYTNAFIASEGTGEINPIIKKVTIPEVDFKDSDSDVMFGHNKLWMKLEGSSFGDKYKDLYYWVSSMSTFYYYIELEDIFSQNIMNRHDLFDFIALHSGNQTLYTSDRLGNVYFEQEKADSLSFYQQDLGYEDYYVFSMKLDEEQGVYLSGYINQNTFNGKKREVPLPIIILSSIAVILVILCLPLVKLKVMSNAERLYIKDVLFSGISLVFIPAIIMLFTIGSLFYFHYAKKAARTELDIFSEAIETSFKNELSAMVFQLTKVKELTKSATGLNALKELLGTLLPMVPDEDQKSGAFAYRKINRHPIFRDYNLFNAIFWADHEGTTRSLLTLKDNTALSIKLNHRSYVSNVLEDNLIDFSNATGKYPIALESIRSVNDGSFEMGVGIPSGIDSLPVLAMSGPLRSLMQPIVRKGYGFCIIDEEGTTLFHSDIYKNLNENFIEETNGAISGYLHSQTERFQTVKYNGANQFVLSKPLSFMDGLSLITFVDKQYVHTKTTIALYTTLSLYFAFLLLLTGLYAVLYGLTYRATKLKQRVFPFNWIRPYDTPVHHQLYRRLGWVNLVGIVYLIVTTLFYDRESPFLINSLLLICFVAMASNYHLLSLRLPVQKRMFTIYYSSRQKVFLPILAVVILVLGCLLGFRLVYLIRTPNLIWLDLIFIGGVLGFLVVMKLYQKMRDHDRTNQDSKPVKSNIRVHQVIFRSYKMYLTTWILLLSLVPIFIFFTMTYQKESEIDFKQLAFDYVEAKSSWKEKKMEPYSDLLDVEEMKLNLDSILSEDNLPTIRYDYVGLTTLPDSCNHSRHDRFDSLYAGLRFPLNKYGHATAGFVRNHHERWSFAPNDTTDVFCMGGNSYLFGADAPGQISLRNFHSMSSGMGYLLLALVVVMIMIVSILIFIIHRVYGLDFKNDYRLLAFKSPEQFKTFFLGKQAKSSIVGRLLNPGSKGTADSFNNTLLVGVNASHISVIKNGFLDAERENKDYIFLLLDMYDIDVRDLAADDDEKQTTDTAELRFLERLLMAKNNDKKSVEALLNMLFNSGTVNREQKFAVFIEHFEYAYNDLKHNQAKLKVIERLVDHEQIAVNLSSEINPTNVYEYYEHEIQRLEVLLKTNTEHPDSWLNVRAEHQRVEVDYRKWLNLLGSFTKITLPLQLPKDVKSGNTANYDASFWDLLQLQEIDYFKDETKSGKYLSSLRLYFDGLFRSHQPKTSYAGTQVKRPIPENYILPEDYIMKVQEVSYAYYFSIWNSLSKEERYIVYDIAKDKFVNTNNTDGILDLLNKGILVYDHSLRLMNESFANFILSKVNSDEALEKELENRKSGSWSKASAILVLIIVALIVFISFGQLSILDDLNTLIGSLAAMFTLFLRVGGFGLKRE